MQRAHKTLQPRLSNSRPHHARVCRRSVVQSTSLAGCFIERCGPSSVITTSLSLLLCCYCAAVLLLLRMCVRCVGSFACAAKIIIRIFGNMIKWSPCSILAGTRFSRQCRDNVFFFSSCFQLFCLYYYVQNVFQTLHRQQAALLSRAGCVLQPAGYSAIHACRPPAEQEATSRVCGSFSTLYCCGFLVILVVAFLSDQRSEQQVVSAAVVL